MKHKLIISIICLLAAFTSCKKAPISIGPIVTQTRALDDFTELHVFDNINISLVRSDTCFIEITTGKNIIDNITTEVNGNILSICNTTTLNWMRPYDYELKVTLYFKDITNLIYGSSGTLTTKNNYTGLLSEPYFYRFEVDGGSGDIALNINDCNDLRVVYKYGTSRLNIQGANNKNLVIYKRSYGVIDARNYEAEYADVTTVSASDCYINASTFIKAEINDLGNIYYKGDPDSTQVTYGKYARGKLLPLQ